MRGLGGLLDCLDAQHHLYVLFTCPLDVGILYMFFCSVFPPQCRGGI